MRWPKYLHIYYFLQLSASLLRNFIYKNIGISMHFSSIFHHFNISSKWSELKKKTKHVYSRIKQKCSLYVHILCLSTASVVWTPRLNQLFSVSLSPPSGWPVSLLLSIRTDRGVACVSHDLGMLVRTGVLVLGVIWHYIIFFFTLYSSLHQLICPG